MKAKAKVYKLDSPGYERATVARKSLTEMKREVRLEPSLRKFYIGLGFLGGGKKHAK